MGKKPIFEHNFGRPPPPPKKKKLFSWILPVLDVRHCCKLSLYVSLRKNNEPNFRK